MKSVITVFLIFTFSFFCHSQTGKVKYKKEMIIPDKAFEDLKRTDSQKYKSYLSFTKKAADAAQQIDYTLKFNKEAAQFTAENILGKDAGFVDYMRAATGIYYSNPGKKERLQQIEVDGRTFLISRKPIKWTITGDSTIISGYTARKAVAKDTVYSYRSNRDIIHDIEAWFIPDISASFGPEDFGGLPGLIIDFKYSQSRYYATKIDLTPREIRIPKPKKGKQVTFEEYQKILAGVSETLKNYMGID